MASEVAEKDNGVVDDGSQMTYKDALLDGEPEEPQSDFHPDPSVVNTSHQNGKKSSKGRGKDGDNEGLQNLKTGLLISGALVAVVGALVVLVKKMKEA